MIPVRDTIPSSRFPAITLGLIVVNVMVFLKEVRLGPHLQDFIYVYGVVPVRYTRGLAEFGSILQPLVALLTSMFLHGGWLHLLGNMWFLWIFGDNVEDRLGRLRYLALYIASGVAAAILHVATNPGSSVPTVGASGAIAGIMGAYFRFYPFAKVETIIPPFLLGPTFVLPAVLFLGYWFLLQFFNGALSLGSRGHTFDGVAWWAHVGGFAFGFVVCLLAAGRPPAPQRRSVIDI